MGMAGSKGMLRRTFYLNGEFSVYTLIALIAGFVVAAGLVAFLVNLVNTIGVRNALSLFIPERFLGKPQPTEVAAKA